MNKILEQRLDLRALGGNFEKIYNDIQNKKNCAIISLGVGERVHVATHLGKKILYITGSSVETWDIAEKVADFVGKRVCILPEKDDVLIYREGFQKSTNSRRLHALYEIANSNVDVIVASASSILQYLPKKENLLSSIIKLKVGQKYDIYYLIDKLVLMGYLREESIEEKTTFCVNGDVVSIFPTDSEFPIRISFFDDEIEEIKAFDLDTLSVISKLEETVILPNSDMLVLESDYKVALKEIEKELNKVKDFKAQERLSEIYEELIFSYKKQGSQWMIPFLKNKMSDIFDYLENDEYVIVFDESSIIFENMRLALEELKGRVKFLTEDGECLKEHKNAMMSIETVTNKVENYTKIAFHHMISTVRFFSPEVIFKMQCKPLASYNVNFAALVSDLDVFSKAKVTTVLCIKDEERARTLSESLQREGIASHFSNEETGISEGINITTFDTNCSVSYPAAKLVIIGKLDLTREAKRISEKQKDVFSIPKNGDYVVHEGHGIGKCIGVKREKVDKIEKEYVVIQYADALLYVPIDQMDRLTRYSGADKAPTLSQLGGRSFEKLKASVKASIRGMAINLLDLYSKRQKTKGYRYQADNELQQIFEDSFPYTETPDQIRSIREIKDDMEKGVVMDRLLCGDVGYGKTEVALRAVFKTIQENKQAVIMAPTTILAKQHFNTVVDRMKEFGVIPELLTRFQTKEEIDKSLMRIKTGQSLVVIGTHRMLSNDVAFNDLGLVVLDEEQRFGVEQKEKLKLLKENVNVLTLSATPIPRTLNMAMTGIRDISLLESPPSNRLPVQTYVLELTDTLLKAAIKRELGRGGQVYVLSNRINTLDSLAKKVRELVPEAKVVIGHGQMKTSELESNINKFYNKEADVLLCTTIIENGLDVADANTMIVCNADKLGLAQLYQIRGRVGRRNILAYGYFTVPEGRVIEGDSVKRLNALLEYTDFGSGFKIAMRDLEIRGSGNVLGKEQHGHIQKVGYDLYCKILKETVDELSGNSQEKIETEMSVEIDAYLDANYIVSVDNKLKIYKRIAQLSTVKEKDDLIKGIEELYGQAPQEFLNLVEIGLVKNFANKLLAKKVIVNEKATEIIFDSISCCQNEALAKAVEENSQFCVFRFDFAPRLVFTLEYMSVRQKFDFVEKFLSKTCKI